MTQNFSGMGTEAAPRPEYFAEAGNSGLRVYGGYVRDEFQQQLMGRNALRIYREMADNSATVGALLYSIKQIIRGLECRVEPADGVSGAEEAAEFAESLKDDMIGSWDGFMTDVLTFLEYGFAPVEVVFKRRLGIKRDPMTTSKHDDGLVGIAKMGLRSQETLVKWLMDQNGNITGLTQQPWTGATVDIPIEKLLLFRTTEERNNPQGRSILRSAWRAWYMSKRIEEIEGIGIERDLAGLPVVRIPANLIKQADGGDTAAQTAVQAYRDMVVNIRRDEQEGVILPSDTDDKGNRLYEIELMSSGGARQFDTNAIITRYKQDILGTVLADFVMMGQGKVGTQSLAQTKVDMFLTSVQGFVNIIQSVLNRQLLPLLWAINGFEQDTMPKFVFDKVQKPDLERMGAYVKHLSDSGVAIAGDYETEEMLRSMAGLPPPNEDQMEAMDTFMNIMAQPKSGEKKSAPTEDDALDDEDVD